MMAGVAILFAVVAVAFGKMTPNEKLKECCATLHKADKECVSKFCDFNAISQTNLLVEVLREGSNCWKYVGLRLSASRRILNAARAKGRKASALNILLCSTGRGNQHYASATYLFCTESFNEIRECFMAHIEKNPPFKKRKGGKGKKE
ncbi:hypothetical protein OSTOST_15636 [Ostertagia ostertagi]